MAKVEIACPRCGSVGASAKEKIVQPFTDGSERKIGTGYGCPRCASLFGVVRGIVFLYGDKRNQPAPQPTNGAPASSAPGTPIPVDERKVARVVGQDQPWR